MIHPVVARPVSSSATWPTLSIGCYSLWYQHEHTSFLSAATTCVASALTPRKGSSHPEILQPSEHAVVNSYPQGSPSGRSSAPAPDAGSQCCLRERSFDCFCRCHIYFVSCDENITHCKHPPWLGQISVSPALYSCFTGMPEHMAPACSSVVSLGLDATLLPQQAVYHVSGQWIKIGGSVEYTR